MSTAESVLFEEIKSGKSLSVQYHCEIRIYPDKRQGIAVFLNLFGMTYERFLDKLDTAFLIKR